MIERDVAVAAPAGGWHDATVVAVGHPTPRGVQLRVEIADRVVHMAGQHYVIRLTAPDGYRAQRSYSIASAPANPLVEFYIERLSNGEVSPFLSDGVEVGDKLSVRGPIGGWFVWDGSEPMLGIGGGSGVVPLVAMLRHAADLERTHLVRLAVSARSIDGLPFASELVDAGALVAITRESRPSGTRPIGRLMADELALLAGEGRHCYVCGSHAFAEGMTQLLLGVGVPADRIRVERFGPSA